MYIMGVGEVFMEISTFINGFKNPPVLFIETRMSLRYLKNSLTCDDIT